MARSCIYINLWRWFPNHSSLICICKHENLSKTQEWLLHQTRCKSLLYLNWCSKPYKIMKGEGDHYVEETSHRISNWINNLQQFCLAILSDPLNERDISNLQRTNLYCGNKIFAICP